MFDSLVDTRGIAPGSNFSRETSVKGMTEDELRHFRVLLETLEEEITGILAGSDSSTESIKPDNAIGRLTRMEAIQAQSVNAEGRRRHQARLTQVGFALNRIGQGTYGSCTRCGEPIPRGRLEFMPEASLCMTCATPRP